MKQLIKLMAVFCLFTMSMPVMANDFSHNDSLVFCSGNCGGHGNGGCGGDKDDNTDN